MRDIKDRLVPIGERIKEARKERNLSQIELAEKANISVPHLSYIEMGRSDFGVSILIRISEALQISTDQLLRPNIPESNNLAAEDLVKIFEGCTPSETASIIEMAKNMKKTYMNAKKEKN